MVCNPLISLVSARNVLQHETGRPGSQDSILLPIGPLVDEFIEATDMPVVGVLLIEEAQRRNRGGSIVTMESRFDTSASGRLSFGQASELSVPFDWELLEEIVEFEVGRLSAFENSFDVAPKFYP